MIIGIDPGLDGALAVLNPSGQVIDVIDTPTVTIKGSRRDYYIPGIFDLLRVHMIDAMVWVERQQAFPQQGVASTFRTGMGYGIWLGLLAGMGIRHEVVSPQVWQREMYAGVEGDGKDRSLLAAARLWPHVTIPRSRHGRADALLIAEWGRRRSGNTQTENPVVPISQLALNSDGRDI